ncbi:LysE family translocator [Geobacter sulfurreducens subsp. ethanolicus]|uniref:LysE family translocator n=1 Tax=Geobacter sulfurreducens TaxID=35554 RepID=UPI00257450B5|nr:LysE family translocator [Geobacter sulfurreducens]BEH11308.1 LysE family translocator [Geobacter sulfurreducens subsp. ethanolicus]
MFGIENYGSFIAAILVFQAVPGPGTLAILNATARSGVGAGFGAVAGTLVGDFAYMIGAVLGLAAVMAAYPAAFTALQWFGTAYLCWMGLNLLRTPVAGSDAAPAPRTSGWRHFRQAFLVSITNPKVVLFFLAFFPLFLRPDAPPATLGALIAHVTAISFLYQAGLVLAGNAVARKLSALPSARRIATRLAGLALIGFGIRLAANSR